MEYKLGIDIGISSVGYGLVNNKGEVIKSGVRMFEASDVSKNTERRNFRSARRLKRRRQNRAVRVQKLLKNNGIDVDSIKILNFNKTLEARNKGLENKLTIDELYYALIFLVKNRGISYLEDAVDESDNDKKQSSFQSALKLNAKEQEKKLPCEIQLERYVKYNKYRGEVEKFSENEEENKILTNVFTTSAYLKEAKALLKEQQKHYDFINDDFIKKYENILVSKRKYYIGPGDEQNRTNYGIYKTNGETHDNIFKSLIGKCSIYNGRDGRDVEFRDSAVSYTAQEFNVLQDLNNLTINKRKLTTKEKIEIIVALKNHKSVSMNGKAFEKIIEKVIDSSIETIEGARIDAKENHIYHNFEAFRKIKKVLSDNNIDIDDFTRAELDEVAFILTINTETEGIIEAFSKSIEEKKLSSNKFNNLIINLFIEIRKGNSAYFNKWHSLSNKIMNEIMEELYETSKNQMNIFTEMGVFESKSDKYKDMTKIPVNDILEDMYNPVVKRSVTQAIKVINTVIKDFGYPTDIVIEMAREDNEDDVKKNYKKFQEKNEKELQNIIEKLSTEGTIITDSDFRNHKALKTKLRLWEEQDRTCLYSGKKISIRDILKSQFNVEIDHIIPRSISFDDSRNNKVLVFSGENKLKGNRTPYIYLDSLKREWNYEKYEVFVMDLFKSKKISYKKMKNLLFTGEITKQEVIQGFINRNLNDTRYSCRVVLNILQQYMKANNNDTKVRVLNGAFTDQLRRVLNINKSRDTFHHHGIDALILCYAKSGLDKYKMIQKDKKILDISTGEVFDKEKLYNSDDKDYRESILPNEISIVRSELEKAMDNMLFSHKVDKKPNRAIANQTIYSTRNIDGKDMIIEKKKDLYTANKKDGKDLIAFINKNENNILMAKHDPKTWEKLKKVMEQYSDKDNPFLAYKLEHGEPIRKYSKKGNGPFVTCIKYVSISLGSCIDITNNYNTKNKKVVLRQLKPFRSDVYYNHNTKQYHIVGIKTADLQFKNNNYVLSKDKYNQNLVNEKVIKEGFGIDDLETLNIEFKFSLYKNDVLQYEKNGEVFTERFLSRNGKSPSVIESKPIYAKAFPKVKDSKLIIDKETKNLSYTERKKPALSRSEFIKKVNVDVLGNCHITEKEKFSLKIKLDNKMI